MKKVFYLIGISTLFLFTACENEGITETITETKMYSPVVKGAIGDFSDATPTTKAGVIEDNPDYKVEGEYFYWHSGDEALLLFFADGDLTADPIPLIYSAQIDDTLKLNDRPFTTEGAVEPGNYTVYGLYPAAAWEEQGGLWVATLDNPGPLNNLVSSAYIGRNMLMKAKAENVVIGEGGANEINLSYQHLGGVIRFHIRNNNNPNYPRLAGLNIAKVGDGSAIPFFPAAGYLANIDDDTLTLDEDSLIDIVEVSFAEDSNGADYDFFLPFISIEGFADDEQLGFDALFVNDEGDQLDMSPFFLDTGLFEGLADGFSPGFSYYFSFTNWTIPEVPDEAVE